MCECKYVYIIHQKINFVNTFLKKNKKCYERNKKMAAYTYSPRGVCSVKIAFEVEDEKLKNVQFTGGCNGNLKGISSLVEGMEVTEVIRRLKGTNCGGKGTSCPDQFAKALEAYLNTK